MMGPSAPNGPPVPIATAADVGLRSVTRAGNAALSVEHPLHYFGDAVAANCGRSVASHESNDQAADYRNDQDRERSAMSSGGLHEGERNPSVVRQIGDEPYQTHEHLRDDRAGSADGEGEC